MLNLYLLYVHFTQHQNYYFQAFDHTGPNVIP